MSLLTVYRSGELFIPHESGKDQVNKPAQNLWSNFYRWISTPHSKFYDPMIHKLVHKMITKVFYMMVAEVKKLGVSIIYADFNRVRTARASRFLLSTFLTPIR